MLRFSLSLLFLCSSLFAGENWDVLSELPVSYKGRIRPMEVAAKLWLKEVYGNESLDINLFQDKPLLKHPIGLKLYTEAFGSYALKEEPLFFLTENEKLLLSWTGPESHISVEALENHLAKNEKASFSFLSPLITEAYLKEENDRKELELNSLAQNLKIRPEDPFLFISAVPDQKPWSLLKVGEKIPLEGKTLRSIAEKASLSRKILSRYLQLTDFSKEEAYRQKTANFSLQTRMKGSSFYMHALSSKHQLANVFPLSALKVSKNDLEPVSNFTLLDNASFLRLQKAYFELEKSFKANEAEAPINVIKDLLSENYLKLPNSPSPLKLKLERIYYLFPFLPIALGLYLSAFFFLCLRQTFVSFSLFTLAALTLGGLLLFRVLILLRPPVSNMDETLLFVPFTASLAALMITLKMRSKLPIAIASFCSFTLLFLAYFLEVDKSLESVPPVLNSNFWLAIHVLMVVSSYSLFIISAIAAHGTLILTAFKSDLSNPCFTLMRSCILIGTLLLISGTLLGGVWAAESWGRFWDWDPKESWAFISSGLYLAFIHLMYFKKIGKKALAFLAIFAFQAILFTWYGVNYILGAGLHSYGFGNGGESYFYSYLVLEALFVLAIAIILKLGKSNKAMSNL